MKAVIYARYSSDSQREESIEGQIRECKAFAEKNAITILSTYIDRALSAKTDNRPEFQRMIKDSGLNLFDIVIVWKLDRFARNRYDSAHYKSILRKNGVKVLSATEVISEGAEGIILESVLEGYAEYYSAELAEKVVRGMTENALKCKFNGGTLPVGYIIDSEQHFQIDPLTAPAVLDAFTQYAEGATIKEVSDSLNVRGITTKKNKPMSINSVTRMLKNRRYIGEYQYRDVIEPSGIPAIVPHELFERVQEKMEKNKKAPARHKAEDDYLLTTKLFCGKCKSFMIGESGVSHTANVHRYYKCVAVKRHGTCNKKTVKKEWIENLVLNHTMQMIMDDSVIEAIAKMVLELQNKENTALPLLKQQLSETERGIQNMLNAIQQGIFTISTKNRLDELEARKSDLEVKILQEEMQKPVLTYEQIVFWLHRFRKLDVRKKEHRQRLIDSFVNAIYLYDDKMILVFNYKDGTKTISFDDIKGSDLDSLGGPRLTASNSRRRAFSMFIW
ncbi:MAG: recombinase family protein [Eubacteriales bacterium]|nr:recombinase family protein [Oscillospiraceae bacterium]MDD4493764.1 recombinase family protein [Eubacteriales bacterium]